MNLAQREQLGRLLEHAAAILDIPDELFEEAVQKYTDVGEWLEKNDAAVGRKPPAIYTQGSFRLGTVVRPLTDKDEYDIDLVYCRDIQKESTTQKELKDEAGEHLRGYLRDKQENGAESSALVEGNRCWTLAYGNRFHMDVLPVIPDAQGRPEAILLTDRDLREWQHSNPIGYAEWFKQRMRIVFLEKRAALALQLKRAAEKVPEWKVKTPLQRAVQILKRHRDIYFQEDQDDKPVSIIITTLAANAYDNQVNLYEALLRVVRGMPKYIEKRAEGPWVPNPVNNKENFADKWRSHPQRAEKFFAWLQKVEDDMEAALSAPGIQRIVDLLGRSIGAGTMTKAAEVFGGELRAQRSVGGLTMAVGTGMLLSDGKIQVKDHTFYGHVEDAEDA